MKRCRNILCQKTYYLSNMIYNYHGVESSSDVVSFRLYICIIKHNPVFNNLSNLKQLAYGQNHYKKMPHLHLVYFQFPCISFVFPSSVRKIKLQLTCNNYPKVPMSRHYRRDDLIEYLISVTNMLVSVWNSPRYQTSQLVCGRPCRSPLTREKGVTPSEWGQRGWNHTYSQ